MSAELSAADLQRLDTLFERGADLPTEQQAAFIERECAPHPVLAQELRLGRYLPNPYGLHDVHGNAFEWCQNAPYAYGPGAEPTELVSLRSERMCRGGSSRSNALLARSAARLAGNMDMRLPALGIRPARRLDR